MVQMTAILQYWEVSSFRLSSFVFRYRTVSFNSRERMGEWERSQLTRNGDQRLSNGLLSSLSLSLLFFCSIRTYLRTTKTKMTVSTTSKGCRRQKTNRIGWNKMFGLHFFGKYFHIIFMTLNVFSFPYHFCILYFILFVLSLLCSLSVS